MYTYTHRTADCLHKFIFYGKFHPLLCMCVKRFFPAFQSVSADWGLTQGNYFREQDCGIDMALLQNPVQLKIRLFCSQDGGGKKSLSCKH